MKVEIYNTEGKKIKDFDLSNDIFAVKIKSEVVHEVFISQTANQRQPWADTKDRGEVRGGGRKPWAQKGTGRARHGSNRSPIWTGGGVTFGPLTIRNYKKDINKKVRRLALKMCLTDRVANQTLLVVENFDFSDVKTKRFVEFLNKLPLKGNKKTLVVISDKDDKVIRMTKNLLGIKTVRAQDLNVVDVLNKPNLLISVDAIGKIEDNLKNK